MSSQERYRNPLERDGSHQNERSTPKLDPDEVLVDERTPADLLLYARGLGEHLKYYTIANDEVGNWVDFIKHDASSLVAEILRTSIHTFEQQRLADQAELIETAAPAELLDLFVDLLDPIWDLVGLVDGWYRDTVPSLGLRAHIERLIGSGLSDGLRKTIAYARRLEDPPFSAEPGSTIPIDLAGLAPAWGVITVEADPSFLPSGRFDREDEVDDALRRVTETFRTFHEAVDSLVRDAPDHLIETLKEFPGHQPHMALFLAFVELLEHPRSAINGVTARHLRFYYEEVLQLGRKPEVPDLVHIIFELARGAPPQKLAVDTYLKAEQDASGTDLVYGTDGEFVVNRTTVDPSHGLKTVFVALDSGSQVEGIHAAPDADSADGLGADLVNEEATWATFGGPSMPPATIGFALASPMFRLAQGERTICVTLRLRSPLTVPPSSSLPAIERILKDGISVRASGAEAWIGVEVQKVTLETGLEVGFELHLNADDDAVVPFDGEVLPGGFSTSHPILTFTLGGAGTAYSYRYLYDLELEDVQIEVEVAGMTDLLLENDHGVLDPAKPFHPFGSVPKVGSGLFVGSPEAFAKAVTSLDLRLTWADLPAVGFRSYYQGYDRAPDDNQAFEASIDLLSGGVWVPKKDVHLFDGGEASGEEDAEGSETPPSPIRELSISNPSELATRAAPISFERLTPSLQRGFLRLRLVSSFLHSEYPKLLVEAGGKDLPNPPYTPLIAGLKLDYRASQWAGFSEMEAGDFVDRVEQVFQIWPFGWREIFPVESVAAVGGVPVERRLIPDFPVTVARSDGTTATAAGTLYIGLDDLDVPQNLSLLVRVAEGSADPDLQAQDVVWSYLVDGRWVDFGTSEVLSDQTNGLLTSGIIRFALPGTMTNTDTILLPRGLHWIKAAVHRDVRAVSSVIAFHTQAATASFRDRDNDPNHLAKALEAGTISRLQRRDAAIKEVIQPYASFGGRMAEDDNAFFVRVSERLRHKDRAVTIFDYERLVLERFPEIYKVKCINHTDRASEYAPGHVRLIVVPDLRNRSEVDPFRPKASLDTLGRIGRYLMSISPDFAQLDVTNPDYEELEVRFDVRFRTGKDRGYHTGLLNEVIIRHLSPWVDDDIADLALGGRIHRSSILQLVEEEHAYVDFVTNFQMYHVTTAGRLEVEEAKATTASTVLVSARRHVIGQDVTSCLDEDAAPVAEIAEVTHELGDAERAPYLGNTRTRELHDLRRLTLQCQVDEIPIDRKYSFRSIPEARSLGYDLCAYCFGPARSQR